MAMAQKATSGEQTTLSIGAIIVPLVAIIIGIFMVILDGTAVNVALPTLVKDFGSTLPTAQWTITGYALAQAAVIPLAGWLSDRFGAKQIFLISVALFTIGSILCATAPNIGALIAFRVLQGLGGGCVLPIAMAYVYRLAPPERVGAVMGMMGIPILIAPAIGPVLSGWLVQYATWRWIFLINLPIGIVGLLIGLRGLPAISRQLSGALDAAGSILGPLAFAALSYGISQGSSSWTSAQTRGGLIIGGIALIAFIIVELRVSAPLLELRVFKSLDFSLAIIVQWVAQFAMFGALLLVPLFLQQVRHIGPFDTGVALLPQAIAAAIFMPLGGMLFDRIGARPLVVVGMGIVAGAIYLLSRVSTTTMGQDLILPLAMTGAGMGLMMMALNTHLINAAPRKLVGRVTSLTNALQQVINSLSTAGLITILTSRITTHAVALQASAAHQPRPTTPPSPAALDQMRHALQAVASTAGFDDTFKYMVFAAVVAAIMGVVLRRNHAAQSALAVESDAVESSHAPVGVMG